MDTLIKDYALRFYVRDIYTKHAGKRGGEVFKPYYKKDLKPFQMRVRYAVDRSSEVVKREKYQFSNQ